MNRHMKFAENIRSMSAPDLARAACDILLRVMDSIQTATTAEEAAALDVDAIYADLMQNAAPIVARLRVLALERGNIELLQASQALAQEVSMGENILRNALNVRGMREEAARQGLTMPAAGSPELYR